MELSFTADERKEMMLQDLNDIEQNCSVEEDDDYHLMCEMKIKQSYFQQMKTIYYIRYHDNQYRLYIEIHIPKLGFQKLEMEKTTIYTKTFKTKEQVVEHYLEMQHDDMSSFFQKGLKKQLCWFLSRCLICNNDGANISCPQCNYTMCPLCVGKLIFQSYFKEDYNEDEEYISCPQCKLKFLF